MNAIVDGVPSAYLCIPAPGERTMIEIESAVRKLALRLLLTYPASMVSAEMRRPLAAVRKVVADLVKTQAAVVFDAISNVDVMTPLLVLDIGEEFTKQKPDNLLKAAIGALLPHLAHRAKKGAIPESILWDLPLSVLPDVTGHRVLRFDPPARGFIADPLGLEIKNAEGSPLRVPEAPAGLTANGVTTDRPFYRLHPELPRLVLSTYDSNPLSMYEAHPDKDGNAISLGDHAPEVWTKAYYDALEIIRLTLPTWFEEAKITMRRLVPVGYLPERHLSATYREAPHVAYMTLCENPMTIAEAIIHETQHTKINQLSWIDPIVHNGLTCWTQSPVRPDLRPLWGVLLAAHAFVPVAIMHKRLADLDHPCTHTERFPRRRCEVIAGNHRAMTAVVEKSEATDLGRRLIQEMNAMHEYARTSCPPPPPGMDIDPEILPPG